MIAHIASIGTDNQWKLVTDDQSMAKHKILAHGLFAHRLVRIDCHWLMDWFSKDGFRWLVTYC